MNTVVESTLSKGESDLYKDRSASDQHAMATLGPTYGLGVGWGSARSSSLIPGIVANGGIFGAAMVLWFVIRVLRLSSRARRASPGHPGQLLVNGFTASICCQIATALMSAPMISGMDFYLQLGCVLGVLVRMSMEPRARGSRNQAAVRVSARGPPCRFQTTAHVTTQSPGSIEVDDACGSAVGLRTCIHIAAGSSFDPTPVHRRAVNSDTNAVWQSAAGYHVRFFWGCEDAEPARPARHPLR